MSSPSEGSPTFTTARVAAGALFVDDEERVLLVRPTYKPYWDIPGGYVEPGETPRAARVREIREELGITPPIGDLLSVDWAPHADEGDKVLFIFDGGSLSPETLATVHFTDGELDRYTFASAKDFHQLTLERLARRLERSLAARRAGRPAYLESGESPAA